MIARKTTLVPLAALGLTAALALSACGGSDGGTPVSDAGGAEAASANASGKLAGAGASSAESAESAWTQGFTATNPEASVTYDSVGSGAGREQFLNSGVQFAGTDAALTEDEIKQSSEACQGGKAFDVPVYISPIAVVFNLKGVDDLQLSPETIAGIFAGDITTWNDPAIAEDNPDVKLPSTKITPVHRSDSSGTTENFTQYLEKTAPKAWKHGEVEDWPVKGGQSGDGTSGLVSVVEGGDGTIGYADASKAGNLGIAKIKVGDEYVEYSPEAASKAVEDSPRVKGREKGDVVIELDRTLDDPSTYPLVLVSYMALCDTYEDKETADLVKSYASYVVSSQGQKAAGEVAGNAPLSDKLSQDATASIEKIKAKG
ncbi:phosphate ABC transporter substrate-binding protein PstS [Brachybacterium endophyticum]|uniref:Phosphate-binding protein n=1 Tax=Brachybacterium endophyticum TaxID=2182385 RepID=A0A2U2RL18_9MICO|nr:phosphate ABC transporter substrate-binding protein PstS [Brachybacterium endophyticum]PWH06531.1 phosphate ABC transporter substrate-binding protein PstS [Brachybacterium endophyticum]